jgi:hypothetical protein
MPAERKPLSTMASLLISNSKLDTSSIDRSIECILVDTLSKADFA